MLPHDTSRHLSIQIRCSVCILTSVPIKGSFQTHVDNFITSQSIIKQFTDRSVSLWHIFFTQNQIVNQVNIFFSAVIS